MITDPKIGHAFSADEDVTGGDMNVHGYRVIDYPFDKYQVKVLVSPENEFIGIIEIEINADFRSYKQRLSSMGAHNVEDYYKEED